MNGPLLCLLAAALAGLAATLLELWWLRSATGALPGTVPAAALVVPAFLLFWSAGSALAGRLADRVGEPGRSPVTAGLRGAGRWFAASALAALAAPWLLEALVPDPPPEGWAWRLAVGTAPVAPAALLLAGALPWLAAVRASAGLAPLRATGPVAAAVAAGGAAGCLLFGAAMQVEPFPIGWSAAALAAAALVCWLLAQLDVTPVRPAALGDDAAVDPLAPAVRPAHPPETERAERSEHPVPVHVAPDGSSERTEHRAAPDDGRLLPWVVFGGALLVGGQLALLRTQIQRFGDSLATTAEALGALHVGMAAGALLLLLAPRRAPAGWLVGVLLLLAGLGLALPGMAREQLLAVGPLPSALALFVPLGIGTGSLVTAASRVRARPRRRFGSWVGDLGACSTLGGLAGGALYAHVLAPDPDVGTPATLHAMATSAVVAAAAACAWTARRRSLGAGPVLLCWLGVGAGLLALPVVLSSPPAPLPWRRAPDEVALLAQREGPYGVLSWVATDGGGDRVRLDHLQGLGGSSSAPLDRRMGRVAAALAPGAGRALALGLGRGHTLIGLWTTTRARVECVERNRQLVELVREVGLPYEGSRHVRPDEPEILVADARAWLARHPGTYDLVVGDLFFPWVTGAGDLLTREAFARVRAALTDDGVAVQWLPLHQLPWPALRSVTAAFLAEFPTARLFVATPLANQPLVALVGGLQGGLPEAEAMDALLAASLSAGGPNGAADVYDLHVAGPWALAELAAGAPVNSRRTPHSELLSIRRHDDEAYLARTNLALLAALVEPLTPQSLASRPYDEKELRALGRELVLRAAALQRLLGARAGMLELQAARAARGELAGPGEPGVAPARAVTLAEAADEPAQLDVEAWRLPHEIEFLEQRTDHLLLEAWRGFPGHTGARVVLAERATELTELGRTEQAGALLQSALAVREDALLASAMGGLLLRLGHDAEALEVLRRARELAPAERSLLVNLGSALVRNGLDAEARLTLRHARDMYGAQPMPPVPRLVLALLDREEGAAETARELLGRIDEDAPWSASLARLAAEYDAAAPPAGG